MRSDASNQKLQTAVARAIKQQSIQEDMRAGELLSGIRERVDVWRAHVSVCSASLLELHRTLSDDECFRARRFRFERDRARFIVSRGMLRYLLSQYLHVNPADLRFRCNRFGKPEIADLDHDSLVFNVSHAEDLVVYAVTGKGRVGVDIEHLKPIPDLDALSGRFFSPREQDTLRSLGAEQKLFEFLTLWTRKEAFLKGMGCGLTAALESIEVLPLGTERSSVHIRESPASAFTWLLQTVELPEGYVGTLAVEES